MSYPTNIVSAAMLICEKALREADGVISAIRVVDIFNVSPPPENEGAAYRYQISAYLIVSLRGYPIDQADETQKLVLSILHPSKESVPISKDPFQAVFASNPGDSAPTGITIIAQLNLALKDVGTYFIVATVNGEEIGRTPFTIKLRKADQQSL